MTRLAVLGCGRIGQMHARNIARHSRTTLGAVFDVHRPAAEAIAAETGARITDTADEIFSNPDIDGVVISTSTDTHVTMIEAGVAAGKPMLCEKPIDLDLDRVNACAHLLSKGEVPVMLGFVRRFDPSHGAVRSAIANGDVGELHQVVITSRDPDLAPEAYLKVSGGIFRDMTIHDFDMARFILNEEIDTVFASGSRLVAPDLMDRLDDFDTVSIIMTTASGKQCVIGNSRRSVYGYDQRVEAFGSNGMASSENRKPHAMVLSGGGFSGKAAPCLDFFIERYNDAFNAEIDAFADVVEHGAPPPVSFEDGRQAQRLAEAALKSATGHRPVKMKEID
ncbi:inositol 2-dehydrogenase [Qingshengfaniella alkalisoli]|uniref:Inositol 2-dehydrogenase n=1 Tax=Qingshengfaniella alkalisoli TaxID=2599296 RepID=A0A5B8J0B1_9RHOB|nr:inositol 2-dehydrogenase [Qingshengfaniella alkalisoli]QDY70621.1 inositol 2-dehydrogenase [Qingshengfaniella alkalisoli]